MSLSVRSQIRSAVVACIQSAGISGIKTVSAWRQVQYVPEELPALLVMDSESEMAVEVIGLTSHTVTFTVTVMASGSTRIEDVDAIVAAALAALDSDRYLGGLALWGEPVGTSAAGEQFGNAVAFMSLTWRVRYRTALGQM